MWRWWKDSAAGEDLSGAIRRLRLRAYAGRLTRPGRRWLLASALGTAIPLGIIALRLPLDALALVAAGILLAALVAAACEPAIAIRPIDLPDGMAAEGWTPVIVARRLADEFTRLSRTLPTRRAFPLRSDQAFPDIEVPRTDLKVGSLVDAVRFVIGRPRRDLTGEVRRAEGGMRLRVRIEGHPAVEVRFAGPSTLPEALRDAAEGLLREVSPYLLAIARLPDVEAAKRDAVTALELVGLPNTERADCAKLACVLTVEDAALHRPPEALLTTIAEARGFASRARELVKTDVEAIYFQRRLDALPAPDNTTETIRRQADPSLDLDFGLLGMIAETADLLYRFHMAHRVVSARIGFLMTLRLDENALRLYRGRMAEHLRSFRAARARGGWLPGPYGAVRDTACALCRDAETIAGHIWMVNHFPIAVAADRPRLEALANRTERSLRSLRRWSGMHLVAAHIEAEEKDMLERNIARIADAVGAMRRW